MTDAPGSADEILSVMVGTAGHVDHGKTSLVRQLTGFDTDATEEERRRGMSIDLAVAPCPLGNNAMVGIVDVPGHEDFIRNMVAGASSIDILMLVVAADDGIMPQTIEHMRIVTLLGMSRLLMVITKIDLVDRSLLDLLREDLSDFARKSGFQDAPIVEVSNLSGEGVEEVRGVLRQFASELVRSPDRRAFRMDVRKAFSAKGHGTVVTGTPCSGAIAVGDDLELLPEGKLTGVRSIQNYRTQTTVAKAHISAAINVRDLVAEELYRGQTLAMPGVYEAVNEAVLFIHNVSADETIGSRPTFRLHAGAAVVNVTLRLIDCDEVVPGQDAFVHARFSHKVVLSAGDRFLLRTLSPSKTIGGGRVLSAGAKRPKRTTTGVLERLIAAKEALDAGKQLVCELLAGMNVVYSGERIQQLTRSSIAVGQAEIAEAAAAGIISPIGGGAWVVESRVDELRHSLTRALARYHQLNKFVWGMKPQLILELLNLPAGSYPNLFELLTRESELSIKHGRLAHSSFVPQISARQIKLREDILSRVSAAGVASVARGTLKEEIGLSESELKQLIRMLVDEDEVAVLGNNLVLASEYRRCREALVALFQHTQVVDLQAFRDATGASRNVATLLLDGFDAIGLTKRVEAGRVLVRAKGRPGKPS